MDYEQAELWLRILNREPDKAVIAADWFEENGRADVADWLREEATAGLFEVWHLAFRNLGSKVAAKFNVCRENVIL